MAAKTLNIDIRERIIKIRNQLKHFWTDSGRENGEKHRALLIIRVLASVCVLSSLFFPALAIAAVCVLLLLLGDMARPTKGQKSNKKISSVWSVATIPFQSFAGLLRKFITSWNIHEQFGWVLSIILYILCGLLWLQMWVPAFIFGMIFIMIFVAVVFIEFFNKIEWILADTYAKIAQMEKQIVQAEEIMEHPQALDPDTAEGAGLVELMQLALPLAFPYAQPISIKGCDWAAILPDQENPGNILTLFIISHDQVEIYNRYDELVRMVEKEEYLKALNGMLINYPTIMIISSNTPASLTKCVNIAPTDIIDMIRDSQNIQQMLLSILKETTESLEAEKIAKEFAKLRDAGVL